MSAVGCIGNEKGNCLYTAFCCESCATRAARITAISKEHDAHHPINTRISSSHPSPTTHTHNQYQATVYHSMTVCCNAGLITSHCHAHVMQHVTARNNHIATTQFVMATSITQPNCSHSVTVIDYPDMT